MTVLSPFGPFRALDGNGDPLSGGKLYTYEAGTSTPKQTFTDSTGTTPNSNPIILNASGYANVWLGAGGYKFILRDSSDALQWTIDNIGGDSANAFGSSVIVNAANLPITSVHKNAVIRQTGGGTLSLLPAATAGSGFYFIVRRETTSTITIDPNASEQINGVGTFNLLSDAVIICDGTAWYTLFIGVAPDGDNTFSGANTFTGKVITPAKSTLVVSSGAITVTGAYHLIDTESAAAVDQLDTINGGVAGQILLLRTNDDGRDVILTHNVGNILTPDGNNISLLSTNSTASLLYDGAKAKWVVTSQAVPNALRDGMKGMKLNPNTLILSNNASDAVNDIDISSGSAISDDGTVVITLPATITKRLDAGFTAGTNQGGLDTGAIANGTYHMWLIMRPDTGESDVLFSASASSPTMPANYTKKKCIGSVLRVSGSLLPFVQLANRFWLKTSVLDVSVTNPGNSAVTRTLASVPTGANFLADVQIQTYSTTSLNAAALVTDLDITDETAADYSSGVNVNSDVPTSASSGTITGAQAGLKLVKTNTSAQVRTRISSSGAGVTLIIRTRGWVDLRL